MAPNPAAKPIPALTGGPGCLHEGIRDSPWRRKFQSTHAGARIISSSVGRQPTESPRKRPAAAIHAVLLPEDSAEYRLWSIRVAKRHPLEMANSYISGRLAIASRPVAMPSAMTVANTITLPVRGKWSRRILSHSQASARKARAPRDAPAVPSHRSPPVSSLNGSRNTSAGTTP